MDKNSIFECPECGLHYNKKAMSESCEAWCSKYKSCNLDIAQQSVEASAQQTKTTDLKEGRL